MVGPMMSPLQPGFRAACVNSLACRGRVSLHAFSEVLESLAADIVHVTRDVQSEIRCCHTDKLPVFKPSMLVFGTGKFVPTSTVSVGVCNLRKACGSPGHHWSSGPPGDYDTFTVTRRDGFNPQGHCHQTLGSPRGDLRWCCVCRCGTVQPARQARHAMY
jgi:hypothetical protein